MLTIHHLGISQSERILFLCEELGVPYALIRYDRDARTRAAPPDYKALHPIGAAPVIQDGDLTLAESGAIVDYIIHRYGAGRLAVAPDAPNYAEYLYWLHFANGTLQPAIVGAMLMRRAAAEESPLRQAMEGRLAKALALTDARLGAAAYLAGEALTAADIMTVFSLTTMRHFVPFDLGPYANVRAYLQRIAARPAYQAAMAKGDPGMPLLLE